MLLVGSMTTRLTWLINEKCICFEQKKKKTLKIRETKTEIGMIRFK